MEYIGQHKTYNIYDQYYGSGVYITRAVKKYGKHNFIKVILFDFDNPYDMDKKEKELVNENYIKRNDTYNIRIGGHNTISYRFIGNSKLHINMKWPLNKKLPEDMILAGWKIGMYKTEEQQKHASEIKYGDKNPMRKRKGLYMLINNEQLKIQKTVLKTEVLSDELINAGWKIGMLDKFKIPKSEDHKRKISISKMGNSGNSRRKKIYNKKLNQEKFLKVGENISQKQIDEGWKYGNLIKPTCQNQSHRYIIIKNIKFSLCVLSKILNICQSTLFLRYSKHWSAEKIIKPFLDNHTENELLDLAIENGYSLTPA